MIRWSAYTLFFQRMYFIFFHSKRLMKLMKFTNYMKYALLLSLLFDMMLMPLQAASRQTENLNRDWKYQCGDYLCAEQPNYDDSNWQQVGIPHSFSIPYFMSKDFYTGYGWYRKSLHLSAEETVRKVFLEFDGVFQEAEVFVNGKKAGRHMGGYTGFSIDISSYIKTGDNLLAVRVNNLWRPDVAPRAGEHVFSGGIYRNVRLVIK